MTEEKRPNCHCGKPATRATMMYRVPQKVGGKEYVVRQNVCEAHYKLYQLGLETYTCPKCKREFYVDLDIVYGDDEAYKKGLLCPFCHSKMEVGK